MKIYLDEILNEMPGLSRFKAGMLLESCVITLHRQKHRSGNTIVISGSYKTFFQLEWATRVSDQLDRTYSDQNEATEHAAECIAILLSFKLLGYVVVSRSVIGTGFDYWLGDSKSFLYQKTVRLEVSGIFEGDERVINNRFKQKCKQISFSDSSKLPAIVSVTSFSSPHTKYAINHDDTRIA